MPRVHRNKAKGNSKSRRMKKVDVEGLPPPSDLKKPPVRDDDSLSLSTILSDPGSGECSDWETDSDSEKTPLSPEDKLERLEANFAFRDKILKRISEGNNPQYLRLLEENEMAVRKAAREQLLSKVEIKKRSKNKSIKAKVKKHQSKERFANGCSNSEAVEKKSFGQKVYEMVIFEMNVSLPAIFSLVLHSLAHLGIYKGIEIALHTTRMRLTTNDNDMIDDIFYAVVLLMGALFARLSGYLYWWLSDRDYVCAKFDYHNRVRLGMWDAQSMLWIKKNDMLRGTLYMIGYYFCYFSACHIGKRVGTLFDESDLLLEDLPSNNYEIEFCPADPANESQSPYPFYCHQQLELFLADTEELKREDDWHTWVVLSKESYEDYWVARVTGNKVGAMTLMSPWTDSLFCVVLTFGSIAVLRWYGFSFWMKY